MYGCLCSVLGTNGNVVLVQFSYLKLCACFAKKGRFLMSTTYSSFTAIQQVGHLIRVLQSAVFLA